jgi:ADP-ribosylglycohydrolase
VSPQDRAWESLVGLSVGDAFGQCFFGLPSKAEERMLAFHDIPEPPWYYTDDTEMSLSIVSTLGQFGGIDQDSLAARFAQNYSYDRAYGPAMHRALARIREGEHWRQVSQSLFDGQGSFGNGAAMRSAPIGAFFAGDDGAIKSHASLAAEVTHSHPEAVAGSIAVALAAATAFTCRFENELPRHGDFLERVIRNVPRSEVRSRLMKAQAMDTVQSIQFPASVLGNGELMAATDTVPFALWCCAQSLDDFENAL